MTDLSAVVEDLSKRAMAAPFPPPALMQRVSGLTDQRDFAKHGCDIFEAVSKASPKPLFEFRSILDFGVGSGRLARMFHGYQGNYCGADVDHELVDWVARALPWVVPMRTLPRAVLPVGDARFDCVISISVFTHMNHGDCAFYLQELRRVTLPDAWLFLTVHGERALHRAEREDAVFRMLSIPSGSVKRSRDLFSSAGFSFVRQNGHLTSDAYEYGITFINERHIATHWSKLFRVERVVPGAIHDFQDIVVLRRGE